ncbi:MAG: Gfo/Idh/MocA family protein [bacterium]
MIRSNRRSFLTTSATGLLILFQGAEASPNERARHAVIGCGGQGRAHGQAFARQPGCAVVAVCDVDPARRAEAVQNLPNPDSVAAHEDYRRILEDPSIDTVSIATPDHWHTPIALAAMQAGKHVYVEKPCCHTLHEGARLVEAARKYQRCVQHGTQSRGGQGIRDAIQYLREGHLGRVRLAKAINHQFRGPIGRAPDEAPPAGVNYDLWLGPAPQRPFSRNRWHYNWHWHWDYGTGDLGNDGIHQVDVARWGLGAEWPHAVTASGGQLFYDDDHETPDTQVVTFEYPDCYLMFEMRLWTDYPLEGHDNGVIFYGDKGILEIGRNGCTVTFIGQEKKMIGGGIDLGEHVRNFLECARTGDPGKLFAPIHEGYLSAALCHLGNIATRVSARLEYDPLSQTLKNHPGADRLVSKSYRQGYELPAV